MCLGNCPCKAKKQTAKEKLEEAKKILSKIQVGYPSLRVLSDKLETVKELIESAEAQL